MNHSKKIKIGIIVGIAVVLIAVIVGTAIGILLSGRASEPNPLPDGFTVTAHTGCMDTEQNTLESLQAALDSGAQTVEFDIRFLADGTPVLAHDAEEKSADSPKAIDALSMVAEYPGITINLDLKEYTPLERLLADVEVAGMMDRVFYTGVDAEHIDAVRAATPDIPCYLNVSMNPLRMRSTAYLEEIVQQCLDHGAIGVNCNYRYNSEKLVELCHAQGLLVSAWTVDNANQMDIQLDIAPDNITTRRPDILLEKANAHI